MNGGAAIVVAVLPRPALAVQAARRGEPGLIDRPVAIVEGGRVLARCKRAAHAGVAVGDLPVRARLLCPDLAVRPFDAATTALFHADLLAALLAVSPRVEAGDAAAGMLYLDARGLERLWGGPGDVATEAVRAAAGAGLSVCAAAGPTRLVAGALALSADPTRPPPARFDAAADAVLAALPLGHPACGLDTRTVALLGELGIRTAAALAALPRAGLLARHGPGVAALHDAIAGRDGPLRPHAPSERQTVSYRAEEPLADLQVLGTLLARLAGELAVVLAGRDLAAALLAVRTEDERGTQAVVAARHWPPLDTGPALATAARALLARRALAAPVATLSLQAGELHPRDTRQLALWGDPAGDRRARLDGLLAAEAAGRPRLLGRWRRDEAAPEGWVRDAYRP